MDKVVLVTVTYNSSMFVRKLVEEALKQSCPPEKIVIVDNDSTEEHAAEIRKIKESCSRVDVIRTEKNSGGAGGFEYGMRYVIESGIMCDWIWFMDDDAYPGEDCLKKLLEHKTEKDAGMLCPMIMEINSGECQLSLLATPEKYLNRYRHIHETLEEFGDVTEVQISSFVGPLFRRSLAEKYGCPDGSLFIEGDDTEYTYRITKHCRGYLIKDAVAYHRDFDLNTETINPKAIWKSYYTYRNRLLFISKYGENTKRRFIGKCLVIKNAIGEMVSCVADARYKSYKIRKITVIGRGIFDGLLNRRGKRIDPAEFNKKLKT